MRMRFECLTDRYHSIEEGEVVEFTVIEWYKGATIRHTTTEYPVCRRMYDGKIMRFHMFPNHFKPLEVL
jgi:hypothetical protein